VFLLPGRAGAHALGAECKLVGARVELEAYYDDDTPARQARIRVIGAGGTIVAEGKTDAAGNWSFARPAAGKYEVQIDAGAGHRKVVALSVPDDATAPRVSEGPAREEFTRSPWPRLLVGLLVIAAASGLFLLIGAFRKGRRRQDAINPS